MGLLDTEDKMGRESESGGLSRLQEIPLLGILLMTTCAGLSTSNAALVKELNGAASVLEVLTVRFGVQLVFHLLTLACWAGMLSRGGTPMPSQLRTGSNWALLARVAFEILSLGGSYYAFRHLPLGNIFIYEERYVVDGNFGLY